MIKWERHDRLLLFCWKKKPHHICKLHETLYGLKQGFGLKNLVTIFLNTGSSAARYLAPLSLSTSIRITSSFFSCMYMTWCSDGTIAQFELSKHFNMKDMGKFHYFIGTQAQFLKDGLFISQHKYVGDMLAIVGMSECPPMLASLPLQLNQVTYHDVLFFKPKLLQKLGRQTSISNYEKTKSLICRQLCLPKEAFPFRIWLYSSKKGLHVSKRNHELWYFLY